MKLLIRCSLLVFVLMFSSGIAISELREVPLEHGITFRPLPKAYSAEYYSKLEKKATEF